jgi:hypothetical protein
MYGERRRVMGELAAWHLAGVVGFIPFTGKELSVQEIHPYKGDEPEDEGVARIKAFIARRRWAALVNLAKGEG